VVSQESSAILPTGRDISPIPLLLEDDRAFAVYQAFRETGN
jgi:hypothetical protein